MRKWFVIGLVLTIIMAATVTILVQIYSSNRTAPYGKIEEKSLAEEKNEEIVNETLVYTSTSEEKISPNAILQFKIYYTECKHTTTEIVDIPEKLVNQTREDIAETYQEWDIGEFTSKEIILYCEKSGICPEHYVIREKDGYIAIYQIGEGEKETLREMTSIVTSYLPETDKIRLRDGIFVTGKEELNATIEDYE